MINFKTCNACHEKKPLEGFAKRPDGRCGRRAVCRKCMIEKYSDYYSKNKIESRRISQHLTEIDKQFNELE